MSKLLLIDGNALFHRAFHAFPAELKAPDGQQTNAVFGFTRILLAALRNLKPSHVAVCFDVAGGTFRHLEYDQYKANRESMPQELANQIPMIWELTERLEVPRYTMEGFEADDLLGTIAQLARQEDPNLEVTILSGDQDLLQLVTDQVTVYAPAIGFQKATLYTPAKVQEKYGFAPNQMIDYKALRGDPSDNIPGVPGIGEVSAKQLIQLFSSLDQIYLALSNQDPRLTQLKPSIIKKLIEHEALARLSYSLATINTHSPISFELDGCKLTMAHPEKLISFLQSLGFKSLIAELPGSHKLVSEAADVFGLTPEPEPYLEHRSYQTDTLLAPILRQMEETGALINVPYLQQLETEFSDQAQKLKDQVITLSGQPFNLDSPAQVADILYHQLNLPVGGIKKTQTGLSTDSDSLQALKQFSPIPELILRYRELKKLLSTYIKPLQVQVDAKQRVHTTYAPDTQTGRLSSKNPNLQNIPSRTALGREIRQAFIAPQDYWLLTADYSQIELRLAAHFSQEPVMLKAFNSDQDFHAQTASQMGVERRVAKIINFSILYGKGAYGFSQDMGISMVEAKQYIDQYFASFPALRQYLDRQIDLAKQQGYLETMDGRRRLFPEFKTGNHNQQAAAAREAVNFPIQGSAADLLKRAMLRLDQALQALPETQQILTVHDELVLEVPKKQLDQAADMLQKVMEGVEVLSVPLKVELKFGPNWHEMNIYGKGPSA